MKTDPRGIRISDFDYDLPSEFIAQKPVFERDASKLLFYKDGEIGHKHFSDIKSVLPDGAKLIFNNTKVIPARLFVTKPTGALIQVFLLNPVSPYANVDQALKAINQAVTWKCMIGNLKRWKEGETIEIQIDEWSMSFTLKDKEQRLVEMQWSAHVAFCDALEVLGNMPLPPYIKREAQEADASRYQTVYAKEEGAVAAPTAGLHFTTEILNDLITTGMTAEEVTLHVGAGTFKPVEDDLVWDHPMHEEYYQVSKSTIHSLITDKPRIATGTTSLRTLETLFWVGVQLRDEAENPLNVLQHKPYLYDNILPNYNEALQYILSYMESNDVDEIVGLSGIMIMPGYDVKSVDGLITNFHLPKSTLLLLIAAMVGDNWKAIYSEAKSNAYRFLSYGDSSLLMKDVTL